MEVHGCVLSLVEGAPCDGFRFSWRQTPFTLKPIPALYARAQTPSTGRYVRERTDLHDPRDRQWLRRSPAENRQRRPGEKDMSLGMIVLIVLVLALLGVIPTWPHSRSWGYAPGGILGLVVVVVLVLVVSGHI